MFRKIFAAFLLLLSFCSTVSLTGAETSFAADALKPFIDSGECPGVISILYDNGREEIDCLGYADMEKKRPIAMDQTFMQCSQTKGFCGVTIAMLVEEGKISLDDPVAKYLPQFKTLTVKEKDGSLKTIDGNILTIRMVMSHTGGFPFDVKKTWHGMSLQDAATKAAATPLAFMPGTASKYSNTGIDIGAAVVEVVTGKPWEVFLQERVLDPLGMKDTTFWPTDEKLADRILLYTVAPGQKAKHRAYSPWMPPPYNGPTVFAGAGAGLWTTANDQIKFYKMLMNLGVGDNGVRILKEKTVRKYLARRAMSKAGDYSLGLRADSSRGEIGHGGAFMTTASVNWRKKQLRIRIVQQQGKNEWLTAWQKAVNAFFASGEKLDESYTGRVN